MTNYCNNIVHALNSHADTGRATNMKRYMKNNFEFFGIPAPKLRQLSATFLQKSNLPDVMQLPDLVRELWSVPQRELQYFALELLKKYLRQMPRDWIDLFEELITQKSWWDTVDALASWQVGNYYKMYPDQIVPYTTRWMGSGNIWLQRTCLIFQIKYKEKTDFELLKSFIIPLTGSKEFFIQKAIGWALREYSKKFPQEVMEFAGKQPMAKLSYREATRIALNK